MAWVTLEGPTPHVGYAWSSDGTHKTVPQWGSAERVLAARKRVATAPPTGFCERLFVDQALPRAGPRGLEVIGVRDHGTYNRPWDRWSPGAVLAALCRGLMLDLELPEPAPE